MDFSSVCADLNDRHISGVDMWGFASLSFLSAWLHDTDGSSLLLIYNDCQTVILEGQSTAFLDKASEQGGFANIALSPNREDIMRRVLGFENILYKETQFMVRPIKILRPTDLSLWSISFLFMHVNAKFRLKS